MDALSRFRVLYLFRPADFSSVGTVPSIEESTRLLRAQAAGLHDQNHPAKHDAARVVKYLPGMAIVFGSQPVYRSPIAGSTKKDCKMHEHTLKRWEHDHDFTIKNSKGERRTQFVLIITATDNDRGDCGRECLWINGSAC